MYVTIYMDKKNDSTYVNLIPSDKGLTRYFLVENVKYFRSTANVTLFCAS